MKTLKKIFVLVLIGVVVSLGFIGCKGDEHPSGDHPTKETAEKEHPSKESEKKEHPSKEAVTEKAETTEKAAEKATDEHPTEHPK